ncbi:pyrokinin receptor [Elysia marginata]|uniref:Pyrokinin receptor n=1 Tax=Elysia marginata TaxID=1093978 RepID=A0AAV4IN97_9GAST|nr:pyrokinin receptor [Elysia marginata]
MSAISLLYFLIAVAIRRSTLNRGESDASLDSSHVHRSRDGSAASLWDRRRYRYYKGPPNRQALRWSGVRNGGLRSGISHHHRIRKSVLKMLVAVVVAFFLCWAPFHTQRLMSVYLKDRSSLVLTIENALFYISGVTYYLSATINPVLYSIMSLKFRQAFRSTLLGCCCFWSPERRVRRRPDRVPFVLKFSPHGRRAGTFPTHCTVVDSSGSGNSNNNKKSCGTGGGGGGAGGGASVDGAGCSSDGSGGSERRTSNGASMNGSCNSACVVLQKGENPSNASYASNQSSASPVMCCTVESRPLVEMGPRSGHHDNTDLRSRGVSPETIEGVL